MNDPESLYECHQLLCGLPSHATMDDLRPFASDVATFRSPAPKKPEIIRKYRVDTAVAFFLVLRAACPDDQVLHDTRVCSHLFLRFIASGRCSVHFRPNVSWKYLSPHCC